MNYNNYSYGYGYPQYSYPMQDNIVVKYGTRKEAEAYSVMPMRTAVFLNNAEGEIYVKSTDNMGISAFTAYKQVFLSDNTTETQKAVLDPKEFVKSEDLKDFATKQDVESLLLKLKELEEKVGSNEQSN